MNEKNTGLSVKQEALPEYGDFTRAQVNLVKSVIAKDATDDELKLFLMQAKRTKLDPFTKQLHFVKRGGQMTVQTGIDGYRAIAERTGELAGIDDAVYDSEDKMNPNKATVTVHRMVQGQKMSFTATARWSEYKASGPLWVKMPYLMLAKCAEALALRKAFPNDLSGIYTSEEMAQAEKSGVLHVDAVDVSTPEPTEHKNLLSPKAKIMFLLKELGIPKNLGPEGTRQKIQELTKIEPSDDHEALLEIVSRLEVLVHEKKEHENNQIQ